LARGLPETTSLIINETNLAGGQIGLLVDSNGGFTVSPSRDHEIMKVSFAVRKDAAAGPSPIRLGNSLVTADISDIFARSLGVRYEGANVIIAAPERTRRSGIGSFSRIEWLVLPGLTPNKDLARGSRRIWSNES